MTAQGGRKYTIMAKLAKLGDRFSPKLNAGEPLQGHSASENVL
jgi:hypothetical protein